MFREMRQGAGVHGPGAPAYVDTTLTAGSIFWIFNLSCPIVGVLRKGTPVSNPDNSVGTSFNREESMPEGKDLGTAPIDVKEQANRVAEQLLGRNDAPSISPGSNNGLSSLDILRQQVGLGRPSPWGDGSWNPPPVTDRPPQPAPVSNGTIELTYGEKDFDAKLAQGNYSKVVIKGLPQDMLPSPWIDDQAGKGFFFWLKNQQNPNASDRSKHYFPSNLKTIEIAQMQGNIYKPIMINADEMRIAASQAFMRSQNKEGFASYTKATDVFTYAQKMGEVSGTALEYQAKLLRDGAAASPSNPYFHIYLADVLAAQAIQPVVADIVAGKQAYFDNPYTNGKIEEALKEVQAARLVTQRYGDILKPPTYEIPLSPFSLNPYSYNPDYYWSGASYQAATREVQLRMLQGAIKLGKLPIELPPALPPKQ
jgi:hypothetical protein